MYIHSYLFERNRTPSSNDTSSQSTVIQNTFKTGNSCASNLYFDLCCNGDTLTFDLYFRLDEKLCLSHLPRVFSICMTCLLSERMEVACGATKTMKVCDLPGEWKFKLTSNLSIFLQRRFVIRSLWQNG